MHKVRVADAQKRLLLKVSLEKHANSLLAKSADNRPVSRFVTTGYCACPYPTSGPGLTPVTLGPYVALVNGSIPYHLQ